MQAMILAAGFGTRLLPHTLIRPKPLFPILNQPLLLLTVKRLQNLGFDNIVVNCHHLREQVVSVLNGIPGVIVQEEEVILGTGGGLRTALSHFRDEPLLVTNGDIYHTVNMLGLYNHHVTRRNAVTLAMHNYPRFNNVMIKDGRPRLIDFQGARPGPPAYDLASMILDPYTTLDEDMKTGLLEYYVSRRRGGGRFDEKSFVKTYPLLSACRLLQALGAYGNLSRFSSSLMMSRISTRKPGMKSRAG